MQKVVPLLHYVSNFPISHQFAFHDAQHEFSEQFLGLRARVLEGLLYRDDQLLPQRFRQRPTRRETCLNGIMSQGHRVSRASSLKGITQAQKHVSRSSCLKVIMSQGHHVSRASCLKGNMSQGHHTATETCLKGIKSQGHHTDSD